MNEKFVINIGRQLGSGGRYIGEKLAEQLGIAFYDRELIQLAAQESGLGKEFFEKADETKSFSLFGGLFGLRNSIEDEGNAGNYLCNETLFKIQSDVIRKVAANESCVIVGRCADYILAENPRSLSVFICADPEDRIQRVAKYQQVSEARAAELIEKTDKKRSAYYNYYTGKVWGAAASYHLCINSSVLGIDETVSFIRRFAEQKLKL